MNKPLTLELLTIKEDNVVFCKDCKFYEKLDIFVGGFLCTHPTESEIDYETGEMNYSHSLHNKRLNQFGKCKNYIKKEEKIPWYKRIFRRNK